jgi:hypothetical protein
MDYIINFVYYKKNEHMILSAPIFVPKLTQKYIDDIWWVLGMREN